MMGGHSLVNDLELASATEAVAHSVPAHEASTGGTATAHLCNLVIQVNSFVVISFAIGFSDFVNF